VWQDFSFEGSQVQLGGSGAGADALPALALPPLPLGAGAEPLPLQAHCSVDSHRKPLPQSLAVVHGSA